MCNLQIWQDIRQIFIMYSDVVKYIRELYKGDKIALHEPVFTGREKDYLCQCIDSRYVSYVGEYVPLFEKKVARYVGCEYAIATVNGTAALHIALKLAGVEQNTEVLAPALTFVATINAVTYLSAQPVFIDSERDTLGMDPSKLERFLKENTHIRDDGCYYNKETGRRIAACTVVHIFGHPAKFDQIKNICDRYAIPIVEDAAESLGSLYFNKHTGTLSQLGVLSFNGNKIITTGGGGMILTNDADLARRARHLTTTARTTKGWDFIHDEVGYNYRMPSINAALGLAQIECIDVYIERKRQLASNYHDYFGKQGIKTIRESEGCRSNCWLNAIILKDRNERNAFLEYTNSHGIMTRPIWKLMPDLPIYQHCQTGDIENARWLENRVVNLPSSVRV